MGVSQLWSLLDPASSSTLLSSLSGKKVAVDASIWLYQFMMAMRDAKTGETLNGAHLIGFLNRILKLLYHGIYPVFVYDGGVPELKKMTIQNRREKRQYQVDKVEKVAEKLLEKRLKLYALEGGTFPTEQVDLNQMRKEIDEYELPPSKRIKVIAGNTIHKADVRMPAEQELFDFIQEHTHQIDLDKVDIDNERFKSLPLEKQHEIILSLKNQSRIPSLSRVQEMVESSKTAKDFSLLQIKNLVHRATLTDRYHNTLKYPKNGIQQNVARRVEGFRQREFILSKDEGDTARVGWDMRTKENIGKAVVDLSGLQGFSVKPKTDFTDEEFERAIQESKADNTVSSSDYLEDGLTEEEIWRKIVAMEKCPDDLTKNQSVDGSPPVMSYDSTEALLPDSVSIDTVSISDISSHLGNESTNDYLADDVTEEEIWKKILVMEKRTDEIAKNDQSVERPPPVMSYDGAEALLLDSVSIDPVSISDISTHSKVSFLKQGILRKHPEITSLYPNLESEIDQLKVLEDFEKEIHKVEKRLGKEHRGNCISAHEKFLQLLLEKKKMLFESTIATPKTASKTATIIDSGIKKPPLYFEDEKDGEEYPEVIEIDSSTKPISVKSDTVDELLFIDEPKDEVIIVSSDDDYSDIDWEPIKESTCIDSEINDEGGVKRSNESLIGKDMELIADKFDTHQIISEEKNAQLDIQNNFYVDVLDLSPLENEEYFEVLHEADTTTKMNRQEIISDTRQEILALSELQKKDMKHVGEISTAMIEETKDLLRLFGIPFMTSPMEAESQCAYLYQAKIVDGIITDDSDVFLFGGDVVYKNLFNAKKYIEKFNMADLFSKMKLKRHHLIQLAYLLGSDYTPGLKGIGPVSGVEIVTNWASEDLSGLLNFKFWVLNLQAGFSNPDDSPIQKKLRNICKKLEIPENFPNPAVFESYMNPVIETKSLSLSWKDPQLELLTKYLQRKLNWTSQKVEDKIIPVLKEMHSQRANGKQTVIDSFFASSNSKTHKSKRIAKATIDKDLEINPKGAPGKRTFKASKRGRKKNATNVDDFL